MPASTPNKQTYQVFANAATSDVTHHHLILQETSHSHHHHHFKIYKPSKMDHGPPLCMVWSASIISNTFMKKRDSLFKTMDVQRESPTVRTTLWDPF